MKKICGAIVMVLTVGLIWSHGVNAQGGDAKVEATNFVKASGVITDVETKKDTVTLTVETISNEPQITFFNVTEESLVFNSGSTKKMEKSAFQKGQQIEAYYDKNKPMILIYPAQISPELVIVHDEKKFGSVKVGKFDEELRSLDNELNLKVNNNTILENTAGEKIELQDLSGKELIVFYTMATKSIPAQTIPTKVVALNYISPELKQIITNDYFIQNGIKMIPLRKVAEQLGYEVKSYSTSTQKKVTLTKGNSSIQIIRDMKVYSYNKSLQLFLEQPVLKDKKTYVSEEILEILK
ncbi:stalk domain-containing protein [Psychrobacillus sp. NPDC096623]|uniref:stalk domain-containing protein n=1 Tax=Psychrobacillus sp. NPDC096623 TaxID=3364492 RepID=UPI003830FC0C